MQKSISGLKLKWFPKIIFTSLLFMGGSEAYGSCFHYGAHDMSFSVTQWGTFGNPNATPISRSIAFNCDNDDANSKNVLVLDKSTIEASLAPIRAGYDEVWRDLQTPTANRYWFGYLYLVPASGAERQIAEIDFLKGTVSITANNIRLYTGTNRIEYRGIVPIIWSDAFTTKRFSGVVNGIKFGESMHEVNWVRLLPSFYPKADACESAYKVDIQPPRINFGSRTTKNMNSSSHIVSRSFIVRAYIERYWSPCQKTATPEITMSAENTSANIIDLKNGTEIAVTDQYTREPMLFNQTYDLGVKIGSHPAMTNGPNSVQREYKLDWRRKPGEVVSTGGFRSNIKVLVHFK